MLGEVGWTKEVLGVDVSAVPYGCFDDPSFAPPKMAVWAENFPEWMGSLAPVECTLENQPDSLEGFRETLIRFGVM